MATAVAMVLSACSASGSPEASAARDAGDAGLCLLCSSDAETDDAGLAAQVKGKIDQIRANVDGCHGDGAGGMGRRQGTSSTP